jgi:chromosome segregation ATPase
MTETNRCEHDDATRNGCFDCMRARIKTLENTVRFHKKLSNIRFEGRRAALAQIENLVEKNEVLEDELIDTRSDVVGADETINAQRRHIEMLQGKVRDYARQLDSIADRPIDRDAEQVAETQALVLRAFNTDLKLATKKLDTLGRENLDLSQLVETLRQTVREYQHDNADLLVRLQTAREGWAKDARIVEAFHNDRG